ncbi:MAG: hypothetical protein LUC47_06765, partial [Clostridiales bacterium]|nr:hypothetical protein [Clostridiales bacterium]
MQKCEIFTGRISDREYDRLVKQLDFFDSTRNTLLTFSFTAVIAILGAALSLDLNEISCWICLMPFLLIIPFSARISYYRLASIHVASFLRVYAPDKVQFMILSGVVGEGSGLKYDTNKFPTQKYNLIAWLINHEMFLLGIISAATFYLKYISCKTSNFSLKCLLHISEWSAVSYLALILPIIC